MRVSDYIFNFLANYGVQHVFMVSGGGAMHLNDALGQEKRIKYICNHHEQGSAIAAEGYSRATGKLSVVNVTTGPGGTNALTGVIGQWLDSIPVLYLSGQVKFETCIESQPEIDLRQLGDQEINIVDIVKPVTKYAKMVTDPSRIRYELEKAIKIATSGRKGPVWLDIPLNVQGAIVDPDLLAGFSTQETSQIKCDIEVIEETLNRLKKAKSPVIIAGHGIRLADCREPFLKLIEKLQIPVLATFNSFDLLPTNHPLSVGPIGTIGTRAGNIALQNADFVLSIGSRNNIRQISYNWEKLAPKAKSFIVVDIDQAELNKKTIKPTLKIHTDAKLFVEQFYEICRNQFLPSYSRWLEWTLERKKRYPVVLSEYYNQTSGINPYVFTHELTKILPDDALLTCTNATPSIALFQAGIIKEKQRMFANSGCAAMGYGLPAAIGAGVGSNKDVFCLEGDGSLMMNLQELQTVSHYDLPVKLFLYNNNEYCSIRQTHDAFFAGRHTGCDNSSGVNFPNWQEIAKAFDIPYFRIDNCDNLDLKLTNIIRNNSRVFCDIILSPGYVFQPKVSSKRLPDGRMISKPLDDMAPFLSDEEIKSNIYV